MDRMKLIAALVVLCLASSVAAFLLPTAHGTLLSYVSIASAAVIAVNALIFGSLFPWLMPTTLADGAGLDVWNASSNPYTLTIMTWAALFITPLVIAYQGWTYWVFRKRITAEPVTA